MDDFAAVERDKALRELAQAKACIVLAALDRRCRKTINDYYARRQGKTAGWGTKRIFRCAAAIIAALVLLFTTAFALSEDVRTATKAFFEQFFSQRAENISDADSYVDMGLLSELSDSSVGTVEDTDELQIDVVDIVSSDNEVMIALRVTAKQLDTVLYEFGDEDHLPNHYRFAIDSHGSLFENMDSGSVGYIYSDTDHSLEANQMYLIASVMSFDGFTENTYTWELGKFGYYDSSTASGNSVSITEVYHGPWTITLELNGDTGHSRTLFLSQNVTVEEIEYCIEDIYLTPFSFSTVISSEQPFQMEQYSALCNALFEMSLFAADGTQIKNGRIDVSGHNTEEGAAVYKAVMTFDVPISVEQVSRLHLLGTDIDLDADSVSE